jgi:hypothetical protein
MPVVSSSTAADLEEEKFLILIKEVLSYRSKAPCISFLCPDYISSYFFLHLSFKDLLDKLKTALILSFLVNFQIRTFLELKICFSD